jgi:PIN domain nuclease of toxin-antitoxin system
MRLLVDTGCWLWSLSEPEKLNDRARDLLSAPANFVYLSAASSWEIAIKAAIGKLNLPEPADRFVPRRIASMGIRPLAIEHAHALRVCRLPPHHRDPFDRILIAQALMEKLTILTADRTFAAYKVPVIWCDH